MLMALTLIQYLLIAYLVLDKDVRGYMLLLGAITFINLLQVGMPHVYERMMVYDLLYLLAAFRLQDISKTIGIGIICLTSFFLNWYEGISYYQTEFYDTRALWNNIMIQVIIIVSCIDCNWRKLCNKTHMQN